MKVLPGRVLIINSQIAWRWLIFGFDSMIQMVVVHLTVIVVVVLARIICTALNYIFWRWTVIFTGYQIQIRVCCWCGHSRYIQIRVSIVHVTRIRHLRYITCYFKIRSIQLLQHALFVGKLQSYAIVEWTNFETSFSGIWNKFFFFPDNCNSFRWVCKINMKANFFALKWKADFQLCWKIWMHTSKKE